LLFRNLGCQFWFYDCCGCSDLALMEFFPRRRASCLSAIRATARFRDQLQNGFHAARRRSAWRSNVRLACSPRACAAVRSSRSSTSTSPARRSRQCAARHARADPRRWRGSCVMRPITVARRTAPAPADCARRRHQAAPTTPPRPRSKRGQFADRIQQHNLPGLSSLTAPPADSASGFAGSTVA